MQYKTQLKCAVESVVSERIFQEGKLREFINIRAIYFYFDNGRENAKKNRQIKLPQVLH